MRLRVLLLGGLLVFTLSFALFALQHMFPPQPYGLADDWRVFYAAAHVVAQGGNPYNSGTIHAAEQAAQHYPSVQPSLDDFTDLPVVAVLLRAVTWLPYWTSYAVFTVLGVIAALAALLVWTREHGWKRTAPWLLGAMCSWVMLLGLFSGQFDALLLGGAVAALLLMRRGHPWVAGVCMAVVLLKPHLLWPLPLLLFAVWLPDRRRAWAFAAATAAVLAAGVGLGFVVVPNSSGFFGHLLGFGARVGSVQPDLAGLPGLVLHLPGGNAAGIAVAAVGAAAVVALAVVSVRDRRLRALGDRRRALIPLAGLALWLACAPYAHPNDDVLLFPLLALILGADARALDRRAVAAAALAAIVILPTIWPFHVLTVPVTPVAVTLVAVAGLLELRRLRAAADGSVGEGQRRGGVAGVVVEPTPALTAQTARGN